MMKKMIKIAKKLADMHNYNTLFGIISGLKLHPIHRLQKTHEKISDKTKKLLAEVDDLMDTNLNSKNYRAAISSKKPPCIPAIPVHLGDLVHIEDGLPDFSNELINFSKRARLLNTISTIQQFQKRPYDLVIVEPYYTFLKELPSLEMEDQFEISKELEPTKR